MFNVPAGPGDRGENTGAYIGGDPAPVVFGGHYQAVARLDDTTTGCSPSGSCSSCAVSARRRLRICRCAGRVTAAASLRGAADCVAVSAGRSPTSAVATLPAAALARLPPPATAFNRLAP